MTRSEWFLVTCFAIGLIGVASGIRSLAATGLPIAETIVALQIVCAVVLGSLVLQRSRRYAREGMPMPSMTTSSVAAVSLVVVSMVLIPRMRAALGDPPIVPSLRNPELLAWALGMSVGVLALLGLSLVRAERAAAPTGVGSE